MKPSDIGQVTSLLCDKSVTFNGSGSDGKGEDYMGYCASWTVNSGRSLLHVTDGQVLTAGYSCQEVFREA